jgi:hypothetical protein
MSDGFSPEIAQSHSEGPVPRLKDIVRSHLPVRPPLVHEGAVRPPLVHEVAGRPPLVHEEAAPSPFSLEPSHCRKSSPSHPRTDLDVEEEFLRNIERYLNKAPRRRLSPPPRTQGARQPSTATLRSTFRAPLVGLYFFTTYSTSPQPLPLQSPDLTIQLLRQQLKEAEAQQVRTLGLLHQTQTALAILNEENITMTAELHVS